MKWVVGIDAGGTHTRAVLAQAVTGAIAGHGLGGPGNWHSGTSTTVAASIDTAVAAAFAAAGVLPESVGAVVAGLAGASTPRARGEAQACLAALAWAREARIRVISDLELAFTAAHNDRAGVLVIAGTGSSCLARNAAGAFQQVGGWGALLDDDGSAYDLARRALRAVVRAIDGRGPPTALRDAIFSHWGVTEVDGFLPALRQRPSPGTLAELAPHVFAAAKTGDAVAAKIFTETADALVGIILTALRWCDAKDLPVSLHGGLFTADTYYDAVTRRTLSAFPSAKIARFSADVGEAAVHLARRFFVDERNG